MRINCDVSQLNFNLWIKVPKIWLFAVRQAEIEGDLPAALCVARNRRIWSRAARVTAPKVREQMSHVPGSDHPAACWTNSRSPKTTDKSAYGDRRPAFEPDGRRRGSNQPRDSGKAPMRPRQNILPRARARAWRRVQIKLLPPPRARDFVNRRSPRL